MMINPYEGGDFRVTQVFTLGSHNGLDIVGVSGKKLLAVCDGVVIQSRMVTDKSNLTWQWGNYVTIQATDGMLITYAHLSVRKVRRGDILKKGDIIGVEGNTGYSFGSHCHLEVRNAQNKVTESVNTPQYTAITNRVGSYSASGGGEKNMTKEQEEALAEAKKRVVDTYSYWAQLPAYAIRPLYAMYKAGLFAGAAPDNLGINRQKVESTVITARALRYIGKLSYDDTKAGETSKTICKSLGLSTAV